jgi:hypothetical protein
MAHALTAVTPTTPAAAAIALAPSVPDGGDLRTIESLYGAFQALLNLASIGAGLVTGAAIGDGTAPVSINNILGTHAGQDIVSGGQLVSASGFDVVSGLDATAVRDVIAGRNISATGNAVIGGALAVSGATNLLDGLGVTGSVTASGGVSGAVLTAAGAVSGASLIGKKIDDAVIGVDADHSYLLSAIDAVVVPSLTGTITADHTYSIDLTGAIAGMEITFANFSATHTITLSGPFEGSSTFTLLNNTGHNVIVTLKLIGSTLYPVARFAL